MTLLDTLTGYAEANYLSERPLPTAPDGHYDSQTTAASNADGSQAQHSRIYQLLDDVRSQTQRGQPLPLTPGNIAAIKDFLENPKDELNDRKNLFTAILSMIAKLPPGPLAIRDAILDGKYRSTVPSEMLNDAVIAMLYESLPHPVTNHVGVSSFRTADGSGNNVQGIDYGKAGSPYARNVQSKHAFPPASLPDTGLVFDTLLRARDRVDHPGGNSALTFAFASLVTHSIFRTDPHDHNKNNTSSYLDLSPLYGCNQEAQNAVRDKAGGRGMLYPDTFSEERLLFLPPSSSALLVIFSRNHNYIASMLLSINERKQWTNPPPADEKAKALQDEQIFQTARLINCGHFMSAIFGDYVSGFLGLGRDGNAWSMNPFDAIKKAGQVVNRGEGNHVSVEFNILYRWHAVISAEDEKVTEKVMSDAFGDKPLDQLRPEDFGPAAVRAFSSVEQDPKLRTFYGLKRGPDGKFSDADLANVLQNSTESMAGAYRARGTPVAMRVIDLMGMEQARKWGVCSMQEFRHYLGLKKFESFEEWNSDPEIAEAARKLYGHIDHLELWPGLQAEETMPLGPGSGICCGYTMTRAILADAINLVRGDRFYTTDFTPANLTSWGFQDVARDPHNGAFGAELPKLLFRHLPLHYPPNSVYALFPLFTPATTRKNLTKLGIADQYSFDRPKARSPMKFLTTFTGIRYVFDDSTRFKGTYTDDLNMLTGGVGYMLTYEEKAQHDLNRSQVLHAVFSSKNKMQEYSAWYREKTAALIKESSYEYFGKPGKYVDINRKVINLVSTHWVADRLCGIPLKTKENPKGLLTEQEVWDLFEALYTCTFHNTDPTTWFSLRYAGNKASHIICDLIAKSLDELAPPAAPNPIVGMFRAISQAVYPPEPKLCYEFLSPLRESGVPKEVLVAQVLGLCVGSCGNVAQAVCQVVALYLDDKYAKERAIIIELVKKNDLKSKATLQGYVREGMRLNPPFPGLLRDAAVDAVIPQGGSLPPLSVKAGDRIYASYQSAHMNPAEFPDPYTINPERPADLYHLQALGFHNCPGVDFVSETVAEMMKEIFSLKNLRLAKGVKVSNGETTRTSTGLYYITANGTLSYYPQSLIVTYDV